MNFDKENDVYKSHYWIPFFGRNVNIVVYRNTELGIKYLKDIGIYSPTAGGQCCKVESGYVLVFQDKNVRPGTLCHEVAHIRQMVFTEAGVYENFDGSNHAYMEFEAYFEGELYDQLFIRLQDHIKIPHMRSEIINIHKEKIISI